MTIRAPARIYDFTCPASGSFNLPVEGGMWRLLTLSTNTTVTVRRDGGTKLSGIQAGQGERADFRQLTFTDESGAGCRGTVLIADDTFIDQRITGDVSIIDGEKSRSLAGARFTGGSGGSTPAEYAYMQFWNPSTTKNMILTALVVISDTANYLYLHGSNVQAASLINAAANALLGSTSPTGQIRYDHQVAFGFSGNLGILLVPKMAANTPYRVPLSGPIVIPPGKGLNIQGAGAGQEVTALGEWFEELA